MSTSTPTELFHRLSQGISSGEFDGLADLYAEDTVVEAPFALPRALRIEGREAVREHFQAAVNRPVRLSTRNIVVHETTDPEVVIAEYDYLCTVIETGHEFQFSNIQVIRVRDGLIVSTRDFHDHVALARELGALPAIVAALSAPAPITEL